MCIKTSSIPKLIRQILKDNGITEKTAINDFLFPRLTSLPSPFAMKGIEAASSIIIEFILEDKPIVIWGDYDVDGMTSTAILVDFLSRYTKNTEFYIPDRLNSGYGLNKEGIKELATRITSAKKLLITVDCGITNSKEIELAQQLGFTTIVTDHHEPQASLIPQDCTIVNCKQQGCSFLEHQLAGVGTAFFLLAAIRNKLQSVEFFKKRGEQPLPLKQFLGLVSIGTIADIVPLKSVNRILVRAGFEVIEDKNTCPLGLKILLEQLEIGNRLISSEEISFKIAPLINSAGRLGKPELAVNLFLTQNREEGIDLVNELVKLNKKRKKLTRISLESTLTMCPISQAREDSCVIHYGDIHKGIGGIIASKLVEICKVPSIVLSEDHGEDGNTILIGSARSVEGIDLLKALSGSSKFLLGFGGHKMAAGLSLEKRNFANFKESIKENFKAQYNKRHKSIQPHSYRAEIDQVFNAVFLHYYRLLEPFGESNPTPSFLSADTTLVYCKTIGPEREHLQFTVRGRDKNTRGIMFNANNTDTNDLCSRPLSLKFSPMLNNYNRIESWQIHVHDIQ